MLTLTLTLALAAVDVPASRPCHDKLDDRALAADPRTATGPIAPVLDGLGEHRHPITTRVERAQTFFDQGLKLTYGFNHQEALRAFKEAARLDPDCAMAYWGWALVLGPNINLPMREKVVPQTWEALQLALARRDKASSKERDYIDALARRYVADPAADRAPLDAAYAQAMRELHHKYPDDLDAATLFAAALMELSPWNYWTRDGRPRENTDEILATLETVLARDPQHEGALHYYIHAVEAVDPRRGEKAADALRDLAPQAGHLLHMPSHLWIQLGRYAESYAANVAAAQADESYIVQCHAQGIYPLNYFPHNVHFMAWAAMFEGRSGEALAAARKIAGHVPSDLAGNDWALYETFLASPLFVLARFAKWDEILAEQKPPADRRYHTGIWHYARGLAYAYGGKLEKARGELREVERIAEEASSAEVAVGYANASRLLAIAQEVLAGEIASRERRHADALGHLDRAVRLEDALTYNEPTDWYYAVRHTLGAALLDAGRAEEAEVVYWQDLRRYPENGWSLLGLAQSLNAQGKKEEAADAERRFKAAWSRADTRLASSRF